MDTVLVINADLGPLHRVSLRHAIRMLCRRVAEVHEAEPDRLIGAYPLPKVVRLVQYVVTKWRYTVGKNSWLNTIAACSGCNQRKGDRTPAEAGMRLRFKATAPTWAALAQR